MSNKSDGSVPSEVNMNWYFEVLRKYATFSGRARRKEYWMYTLFTIIIYIALSIIDEFAGLNKATNKLSPLSTLYVLAVHIPTLSVTARRLHDIGKSGWWQLVVEIPLIGYLIWALIGTLMGPSFLLTVALGAIAVSGLFGEGILLLWVSDAGQKGANRFGDDPKSSFDTMMKTDPETWRYTRR
jgi:uncharacterized membrane protein YhaH (DUF805 family)